MIAVTDADRIAAEELRRALADVSGFWHLPGDDGPLCLALARHRERTELQLLQRMERRGMRGSAIEWTMPGNDQAPASAFENRQQRALSGALGR